MAAKWGKGKNSADSEPTDASKPDRISNKLEHVVVVESKPVPKAAKFKKLLKRNDRRVRMGGALLLVVMVLLGYLAYDKWWAKEPVPVESLSSEQLKIKDNNNVENVVQNYGQDYETLFKEITSKPYTEWDKATLDRAYFSLLYADKAGLFTQAYQTLGLIEGAKMNGLNIDDNSYGIDQAERDAIKKRADAEREAIQ